jgi:predicted nucleotidyltransferase
MNSARSITKLFPYAEINELFDLLLIEIKFILKNTFVGMYIGGSLANNSFNKQTSDIDVYIIIEKALSKNMLKKITDFHQKFYLSKIPFAKKIEVSYLSKNDLTKFIPNNVRPYFNEGQFYLAEYGSNFLIELFLFREKGIVWYGPTIKSLIKKISPPQLKTALLKNLAEYWLVMLNDDAKLGRSDYQVFAILTMCRTLYSLETNKITSKIHAAQWAMERVSLEFKNLIEQALIWQPRKKLNKLTQTRSFIKYVLNKYAVDVATH